MADARELDIETALALKRMNRRARSALVVDQWRFDLELSVAEDPRTLRTYEATPRESSEGTVGINWTGERFALGLRGTLVADPDDDKDFRPDGSYAGVALGNWMLSANALDRWWGPGHEGGLILSSNARPIPSFMLQRNDSDPFDISWLKWIGRWNTTVIYGQLEHGRDIPNARFFGWRVNFRPTQKLEIGLSRTAQWCGAGRPCDFGTFVDLLTGTKDNRESVIDIDDEPGNQLAGVDVRWQSPISDKPYALYVEAVAEDEAGRTPSRWIAMAGAEMWGTSPFEILPGSYRIHVEAVDTAAEFYEDDPRFDFAYEHFIYADGYRYRDRVIGHSIDNDGRQVSLGATLVRPDGDSWNLLARRSELNRGGVDPNSVARGRQVVLNLEVGHTRFMPIGRVDFGIGFEHVDDDVTGETDSDYRLFIRWSQE